MASSNSVKKRCGNYLLYECIGKGAYGEVFLAKYKKEKKIYVMKNIKLANSSKKERSAAEQEASLLSQLQHPNIVSYRESFQDSTGCLHIVMGYCEGGDLCSRLKAQCGVLLPENQVIEWFVQIALALQYLHERNILHRDLKTQNIFLTKSDIIKVGDLGIARVLDYTSELAKTVIGTPYYMSPEIFQNQDYNQKSDIWALGCCVYEMSTLKHAFTAKNIHALMIRVVKGELPEMPAHYSAELCDLIKQMLSKQAENRPSASELLRIPFVRQHIKLFLERASKKRGKRKVSNAMLPHDGDSCTMPNSHPKDPSVEQGCSHPKDKVLVDISGEDHHPQPPPSNPEIGVKPPSNPETPVKTPSNPETLVKTPSNPGTPVRTPSDPETLVRNSSSNSKSSGYQSNGDVSPPPENVRESPTTPSQPHTGVQEDKVAQDKNDGGNHPKVAAPKDNKVKPAVKGAVRERSQSDGHDRKPPLEPLLCRSRSTPKKEKEPGNVLPVRSSPKKEKEPGEVLPVRSSPKKEKEPGEVLPVRSSPKKEKEPGEVLPVRSSPKKEKEPGNVLPVRSSPKKEKEPGNVLPVRSSPGEKRSDRHLPVKSSLSEGSDDGVQRSSSATSLSSARERRRKHKQEKQQQARRSFSGAKMVLKSRTSNGVNPGPDSPVFSSGVDPIGKKPPKQGALILSPVHHDHSTEETDGAKLANSRSQCTQDDPKHTRDSPQPTNKVYKSDSNSVSSDLLRSESVSEPNLCVGGDHTEPASPSVMNTRTKAETTAIHRDHGSEHSLLTIPTDNLPQHQPHSVTDVHVHLSGSSSDSLDKVAVEKKPPSGEDVGERRSEELDSMLTILDKTLHLPPSEERRELPPTPPKMAFMTDSQPGGRLHSRIEALRKELSTALGQQLFTKAYNILDNGLDTEDEENLLKSLGQVFYDEYSEKLRQLKFCEESAF